ncbi:Sugar phosphate isomerase/epimerase [Albimonas donghaensis]|uniref:Sugar phosphate isomerase/epimerase n=2 Tax=Albimonas donghaensis TaxID=356660 RepID=A0A1H3FAW4_9RHOB|nr:Sugar phosphate isomerase/epimerase [Albimonas donghaensis]
MRLSMSNVAWAPEERLEACAAMAEHGVRGLEIVPGLFFHAAADPCAPDAATAERALAEIAAQGLSRVSMPSLLFGVSGAALFEGDDTRARLQTGMVRAIDLAGRFGIPNLLFGSPGQRRSPRGRTGRRRRTSPPPSSLGSAMRAQAAGARFAMGANPEVYGASFLNTLEEAADFVAAVDHPAVAPILDLGAMHINGAYADAPGRVARLGPALTHVRYTPHDSWTDASALGDAGWQVPAFDEAVFHEQRRAHALVIPVINEGERIRGQLERIPTPIRRWM